MSLLARIGLWLLQLFASPAVARQAGRTEAEAEAARTNLTATAEVKDAQADIAARAGDGPATVLGRMRDGEL